MVPQAAVLISVGLFGLFFAIGAAYAWNQKQQQQRNRYSQEPLPRPPTPRPVLLGPCGICGGDVYDENYLLPCNHHLHGTCAADIARSSQGRPTFEWADVCRNCVISRVKKEASTKTPTNDGLRNRRTNRKICGHCRRDLLEDDQTQELACRRHQVHKGCWHAIVTSGFTTCAMCMEEA